MAIELNVDLTELSSAMSAYILSLTHLVGIV